VIGTPWPIEIYVACLDGTKTEKHRIRALTPAPGV
jgi:hypothetical protein